MLTEVDKPTLPLPGPLSRPPLEGELLSPLPDNGGELPAMYRESEVSLWLGVSLRMLAKARANGDGPPFVMIGKEALYPGDGLRDWVRIARRTSRRSEAAT